MLPCIWILEDVRSDRRLGCNVPSMDTAIRIAPGLCDKYSYNGVAEPGGRSLSRSRSYQVPQGYKRSYTSFLDHDILESRFHASLPAQ